jgi:regulator of replication initiation timing
MIPLIITLIVSGIVIWRLEKMEQALARITEAVNKIVAAYSKLFAESREFVTENASLRQQLADAEAKISALAEEAEAAAGTFGPSVN